ncbi:nuclear transcription factor Y subunit beta-like isoform X2 [Macrobrachium rosenbergii]|uniref:nuclear transcription factor Y subunit beta-like isoform X2 n=2 Tax=Macrobrachium rosenbergii TaxID=79674 RepID=UPI0034D4D42F
MQGANTGRSDAILIRPPIAAHLHNSAVLKMLHEEEGENHIGSVPVQFGSWPPPGHGQSNRPMGFMTKVSRGPGGRPVEWPPRPELTRSQEQLDQAKMDQVQMQQQHQQQQTVMQQQQQQRQQQQQVTSSVQMKTVKQVQEYQTYEQQFSSGSHGSYQYQLPPQQQQQSFQYQTSHQSVSSSGHQQQAPPRGMEHQIPVQMAPPGATAHQGPKHGVPTPFASMNSMTPPQQNASPGQYAYQNVAPPPQQFSNQNVAPSKQFSNQNVAPSKQFSNQNVAPPPPQQFTNQSPVPPQQAFRNAGPPPANQYASQNATPAQHASADAAQTLQSASEKVCEPVYTSGTTLDNPDGYTSAYNTIRGEWPPKDQTDGPNLTTTYPSSFKLRDQPSFQTAPARVVTSQPAFKITQPIRRRGDDKWPPKGAGEPTQDEVREFIKPKKNNKNYDEFFAQNALPHNYAGYRPPPGTQHHGLLEDGVSNM